ncbi:MAG: hypothetical protein HY400_01230, partial [Elusimicrobia bacterium]|nr:hypothetical protein [Elusimicrobiota bacterium]
LKPSVSYKNELITESVDEKLGKGLFDYNKLAFGVEAEREGRYFKSIRQSLTAYGIRFYHYESLSTSQDLGLEINSGSNVLDFNALDYALTVEFIPFPEALATGSLLASFRHFPDQNIVTLTGEFESKKREDVYAAVLLGYQQKLPDLEMEDFWFGMETAAGLNASYTLQESDQSNYDATRTQFNPDYYDYGEIMAGPFLAFRFAGKLAMSLGYEFSDRHYQARPVQDKDGNYENKRVDMKTHTISLYFSYPLYAGLSAKAQGALRSATSNMKYESTYRYNYHSAHYFVGLGYSF